MTKTVDSTTHKKMRNKKYENGGALFDKLYDTKVSQKKDVHIKFPQSVNVSNSGLPALRRRSPNRTEEPAPTSMFGTKNPYSKKLHINIDSSPPRVTGLKSKLRTSRNISPLNNAVTPKIIS